MNNNKILNENLSNEIIRLKRLYSNSLIKNNSGFHASDLKMHNYHERYLPSLIKPFTCHSKDRKRWFCFFSDCISLTVSFPSRKVLILHVNIKHQHEMPGTQSFGNSLQNTKGIFIYCDICKVMFVNNSDFIKQHYHFNSNKAGIKNFLNFFHYALVKPILKNKIAVGKTYKPEEYLVFRSKSKSHSQSFLKVYEKYDPKQNPINKNYKE
jgi:hypothetical protein